MTKKKKKPTEALSKTVPQRMTLADVTAIFGSDQLVPVIYETAEENFQEIRRLWTNSSAVQIFSNWAVGRILHEMLSTPDKYGARILDKASEKLGRSNMFLYGCLHVYQAWKKKTVAELLELLEQNYNLEFWHLVPLSRIKDEPTRMRMLTEAHEKHMTVEAVKKQVREIASGEKVEKPPKDRKSKPVGAAPIGVIGKVESKTKKITAALASELLPLQKATVELKKQQSHLHEDQRTAAEEKVEALRQVLQEARKDITQSLGELNSTGACNKGRELFRNLRDLLNGMHKELSPLFPLIETEIQRTGDLDQMDDAEYQEIETMFAQASASAARLKTACESIMGSYNGLVQSE